MGIGFRSRKRIRAGFRVLAEGFFFLFFSFNGTFGRGLGLDIGFGEKIGLDLWCVGMQQGGNDGKRYGKKGEGGRSSGEVKSHLGICEHVATYVCPWI